MFRALSYVACRKREREKERERGKRGEKRIGSLHVILKDDNEGFNRGLAIVDYLLGDVARKMKNLSRNYDRR